VVDDLRKIAAEAKTGKKIVIKANVDEFVPEEEGGDLDDFFTTQKDIKSIGIGTPLAQENENDDDVPHFVCSVLFLPILICSSLGSTKSLGCRR